MGLWYLEKKIISLNIRRLKIFSLFFIKTPKSQHFRGIYRYINKNAMENLVVYVAIFQLVVEVVRIVWDIIKSKK